MKRFLRHFGIAWTTANLPRLAVCLLVGICSLLTSPAVRAQTAGQVDPSFGASLGLAGHVSKVLVQADSKILVAGSFAAGAVRLNSNGTTDASFHPAVTSLLAVQPDGKILCGVHNGVARLNADGSLDPTFNAGAAPAAGSVNVSALAIQPDGKIIAQGNFTMINGVARNHIARFSTDGSVDSTFNPDAGISYNNYVNGSALAMQSDGKILVGGSFVLGGGTTSAPVIRLYPDGSLDTTFNVGYPQAGQYPPEINALVVQPDGRILVGGSFFGFYAGISNVGTPTNPIYVDTYAGGANLARLNSDGSADNPFSSSSISGYKSYGPVRQIALLPSGKIVVCGYFYSPHNDIAGFNADGSVDSSFDPGTGVYDASGGYSTPGIITMAPQPDGKVIVGGTFSNFNGVGCASIARISPTGSMDTTFLADAAPGPNNTVHTTALQTDGKVILGGAFGAFSGATCPGVARTNADGTLDTSFVPGAVTAALGTGSIATVAVQTDGKIIVAGVLYVPDADNSGTAQSHMIRLNADGSIDNTFQNVEGFLGSVQNVFLQSDGRMVVTGTFVGLQAAGGSTGGGNTSQQGIARVNADGSIDTSFAPAITLLAVQPDGRIIANGSNGVVRLLTSGATDPTFTPGSGVSSGGSVSSAAVQPDGRIIVTGSFTTYNGVARNCIARLTTNGALDPSFDPAVGPGGSSSPAISAANVMATGQIMVSGAFTTFDGLARLYTARLNSDGSLDPAYNPQYNVSVATVQPDGKVVTPGSITSAGSIRNYVYRLNSDGTLDPGFNPGVGAPSVDAVVLQPDGNVVVGGTFTAIGGVPANALARLRTDGSNDPTFTAPFIPGVSVQSIQRQPTDGGLVVAALVNASGAYTSALSPDSTRRANTEGKPIGGPQTQSPVKNPIKRCLALNGLFDATFNASAGTDGVTQSLALQSNGQIIVGGSFASLNTVARTNLGRLNADGSLDANFNASTNQTVDATCVQSDDKILLGGIFTQVNGTPCPPGIVRLNANGTLDTTFSAGTGANGAVNALKVQADGKIVLGGTFTNVRGVTRFCIARLNADGSLDTGFAPAAISQTGGGATVNSIQQEPGGKLIIAGLFDTVGGGTRHQTARLNTDGSLDTNFNDSGTDKVVRAAALQPDGKTLLGGDFTQVGNLSRSAAARLFGDNADLQAWRLANFGTPYGDNNAANGAMPFGDGVPNLLKYALNLNATTADVTPMTATGTKGLPLVGRTSDGRLSLTFVRRQTATSPGITYNVEFANALTPANGFAVNPAATTSVPVAIDSVWERVTVTDSAASSPQPSRFVHLRVTSP